MKFIKFDRKLNIILLTLLFVVTVVYSFILSNKRYVNFEYGKFDLGNMAQMVWNTSRGNFMEVTDQFGTNMPRWGMSHIDPIIAVFAPFYWFFPHPMLLVVIQQIFILSAIYPLFALAKWKTKSTMAGFLVVLAYVLYPANGFTLVWTGFHGISFVAPLLVWTIWFLERNNFLINSNINKKIIYWALIVLMLMGKEEIGAILALASIFLYFKNKKIAIYTFIVSIVWTLLCFLVFIPSYSHFRSESVNSFLDRVEINTSEAENISGDNFFINRYAYLGSSYGEIIKNAILKPNLIIKEVFTDTKTEALNNLFGPLGYIVILSPFWLISTPDLAIVLLSQDEIFDISNHRIAFVIVALFISLIYLLQFLRFALNKYLPRFKYKSVVLILFTLIVLILNLVFSHKTNNPLYVSGKSFIEGKLLSKVFAKEYAIGESGKGRIPRNEIECLNTMSSLVEQYNPEIYSGPDYLGAQSSLRRVNALFPARFWDANMIIADVYETKTLGVFGDTGWLFNKDTVKKMISLGRYEHIYSCGKMSAFIEKTNDSAAKDSSVRVDESELSQYTEYEIKTSKIKLDFRLVDLPQTIPQSNPQPIVVAMAYIDSAIRDKMSYYSFVSDSNPDDKFSFINYASVAFDESISSVQQNEYVKETYYPKLGNLKPGKYKVFFGIGDLLNASEVYIGTVDVQN